MTRASKHSPAPVRVEAEPVPIDQAAVPAPQSPALTSALRFAQSAALGLAKGGGTLAKGTGTVGVYLLGKGFSLAKDVLSRPKQAPALALVDEHTVADAAKSVRGKRRGRRVAVLVATGAAVAAVGLFVKKQRTETPPVADAPPSLRDLETS
ncbi:hypothetical protein FK531_01010 [Rhodococcus spelaei]|uniref:Cell wall synthesis protein CwsA n=1 Tax=Rhodococcus spelaei TaxID=2546320 RepID=A0A541BQV5_9NOCA|nr:hypothetical protein [Rhodococcus spelaei]TQF74711.1 hypothetical protein FK531_01010 [Rhodococcus spelaei]